MDGDSDSTSPNWAQMLLTGVSAAIDSQTAQPYYLSNPVYNTAGGYGGQAQTTAAAAAARAAAVSSSPLIWIMGAVVVFLLIRTMAK